MQIWVLALLVAGCIFSSEGKVLSQCEQVQALKEQGIPDDQLPDWLCIIQNESGGKTDAKNLKNDDGSWDWGIFQLNDRYWCGRDQPGGGCNINCNEFMNEDIKDDIVCAKLIWSQMGFGAWVAWKRDCQDKKVDVPQC